MEEVNIIKPKLHVFICVNDRTIKESNCKPSCGPKIKENTVDEIKQWIRSLGLTSQVYCTKTSCLGFCNNEGGVMAIYPEGKFIKGINNVNEIKKIISEEINKF